MDRLVLIPGCLVTAMIDSYVLKTDPVIGARLDMGPCTPRACRRMCAMLQRCVPTYVRIAITLLFLSKIRHAPRCMRAGVCALCYSIPLVRVLLLILMRT